MDEIARLKPAEKKQVEEFIGKLFTLLGIDGTFTLEHSEDVLEVIMETKDTGMVIGYHGEVLESLQLILSLCIAQKIKRFLRVSIEVDGYKKTRIEYLQKLAEQTRERALSEHKEQVLMSLKAWERRIVHVFFQDDSEVITESSGEGKDRVLVIKPKN